MLQEAMKKAGIDLSAIVFAAGNTSTTYADVANSVTQRGAELEYATVAIIDGERNAVNFVNFTYHAMTKTNSEFAAHLQRWFNRNK